MPQNHLGELIASKWRRLAASASCRRRKSAADKGYFVVYAKGGKRFAVPLHYLDHPIIKVLLEMAEEEFGSVVQGPIMLPCEEELMDHVISLLSLTPR